MTNNVTRIHTTPPRTQHRACPDWCDPTMCNTGDEGQTFHMTTLKASTLVESDGMDGPQLHPRVLNDLAGIRALIDDLDVFTDLRRAYESS